MRGSAVLCRAVGSPTAFRFELHWWHLLGKRCAEHRQPAGRPLARNFVLDDVPVLRETPILDAHDVNYNPICGLAEAAKPAMQHQHVALSEDQAILITQRRRCTLDQAE